MNPNDLTAEQRKDIEERVAKASEMLKELKLVPKASVQAINNGNDTFGMKVIVYLEDQVYISPIQTKDL